MTTEHEQQEPGSDLAVRPVDPVTEHGAPEPGRPGQVPATPWLERVRTSHRLPEIITTAQPSIADLIEEAQRPEPGQDEPPAWRVVWAKGVALPVKATGVITGWLAESPERLLPAIGLLLLVGTAIHQTAIPVLSWLLPSVLDITTWF
jgi:hypothetical protein